MLNRLKRFIHYIIEYKDFEYNIQILNKRVLFELEKFIQEQDEIRKAQMKRDKLAKEMLLYEDCYIIPKENLKEYINKG